MVATVASTPAIAGAPGVALGRRGRVLVLTVAVAVPAFAVAAVALHLHNGSTDLTSWWYGGLTLALTLLVPGVLIARRHPANPVGWLMLVACVCEVLCSAGREYLIFGLLGGSAPGWLWLGWLCDSLYVVAIATLPVMLMVFPDGTAPGPRSRYLLALPIVGLPIGWFGYLFTGDAMDVRGHHLANPGAGLVPQAPAHVAAAVGQLLVLAGILAAAALLVVRLRRARGSARQQLKWVVWAGTIELVEVITEFVPDNPVALYTSLVTDTLLVAAIGVAILRYRLFDIDVVVNRALVFLALTGFVGGGYIAIVVAFDRAFGYPVDVAPGLIATALVAVAFAPARAVVQRGVDRLVYGHRRSPYTVITQLGRRLEREGDADELAVVVETLTQALKLPYAAIYGPSGELLAQAGTAGGVALEQPLTYQGAPVGQLLVQPRSGTQRFDRDEQRLLADLARQVGAAVHAVRLSADLQASRRRLVSAKEEERRRLRRDLHDGLGPKLAALGLKLDAAHALADTRPVDSKRVLAGVQHDIRETIEDVRRLVYGLRPPALDELGLIAALRECAARFDGMPDAPRITVAAGELPALPAAVEVAAYWIVNEAVTNVVRHAGASSCRVVLGMDGSVLDVRITDDGTGLVPGRRPGVGTSSMSERAAELGGSVQVRAAAASGTEVHARIPCEARA